MNAGTSIFLIFLLLFGSFFAAGSLLIAYNETRTDLQQATQQVSQMQQQILDLEGRLSQTTQDLQAARQELTQTTADRDAATARVDELTQAIQVHEAQEQAQAEAIAGLEAERDRWQARAMQAETDLQAAMNKQNGYVSALLQLNSQKQAVQDELTSLKQTCQATAQGPQALELLRGEFKGLTPELLIELLKRIVLGAF